MQTLVLVVPRACLRYGLAQLLLGHGIAAAVLVAVILLESLQRKKSRGFSKDSLGKAYVRFTLFSVMSFSCGAGGRMGWEGGAAVDGPATLLSPSLSDAVFCNAIQGTIGKTPLFPCKKANPQGNLVSRHPGESRDCGVLG